MTTTKLELPDSMFTVACYEGPKGEWITVSRIIGGWQVDVDGRYDVQAESTARLNEVLDGATFVGFDDK